MTLTDPLDEGQQALINLVWEVFAKHHEFPKFFYVDHCMRRRDPKQDAITILRSFPAVGTQTPGSRSYRAVGWAGEAWAHPDNDGLVWLTFAGLVHVHDNPLKDAVSSGFLAFLQEMTRAQDAILDSPFTMPDIDVDLYTATKAAGIGQTYVPHIAAMAEREWPGISFFNKGTLSGRLGLLNSADFPSIHHYIAAVTDALTTAPPPVELTISEPRALLRALNFLDLTVELILKHPLIKRPPMDRSSLLALDASDENDFVNGLVVLTEILRDLQVPNGSGSGLARLEAHLARELPAIDQDAVHQAVDQLDQIRIVRNSSVHPKPDARLLAAYQALGLPFPIRNFTAAWDSVRGHTEQALVRLQEEIQAARS